MITNTFKEDVAVLIDDNMSYSTNEVAVYWNSSLAFLISSLKR